MSSYELNSTAKANEALAAIGGTGFGTTGIQLLKQLVVAAGVYRSNQFAGPLDAFTENLALAILPFRGFSAYSGPGWRVRDTSDNAEQDVLFDSAGDPVAPTTTGNAAIRWWYDQSGNAQDVPQATAAAQPLWTGNILNGYPVARFDGTDDEMLGADSTSSNRTVYTVARFRVGSVNARAWADTRDASVNADIYYHPSEAFYYFATTPNVVDPLGGPATSWSLMTLRYSSGNTCAPWRNNTSSPSFGASGFTAGTNGFTLASSGGSLFAQIDIAARLTYNAAHSDATRQAIQSVLANKLGITLA